MYHQQINTIKKIKNLKPSLKLYYKIRRLYYYKNEVIKNVLVCYRDLYLLRRLLDKDYYDIYFVYSGFYHTINQIIFLLLYTDYEIIYSSSDLTYILTNIIKIKSNNEIEWFVKNIENIYLYFEYYNTSIQCILMEI